MIIYAMNYNYINNNTSYYLVKYLVKKYPYINEKRYYFEDFFDDNFAVYNGKVLQSNLLQIVDDSLVIGESDLEKILANTNVAKLLVYHKRQYTDFAMIKFMVDFFGKPIDEMINIIIGRKPEKISKIKKQNAHLYNDIMHLLTCDLLLFTSTIFYGIKIMVTMEDTKSLSIMKYLRRQIINKKNFFDPNRKTYVIKPKSGGKYKYPIVKIKQILEFITPYVEFINSSTDDDLKLLTKNNHDFASLHGNIDCKNIKKFLLDKCMCLAVAFNYVSVNKDNVESKPELFLKLNPNDKYLVVEI